MPKMLRALSTNNPNVKLDEQLPELKKQLDDAERVFNKFRQKHNTVDVTKESDFYLTQSITLGETKE